MDIKGAQMSSLYSSSGLLWIRGVGGVFPMGANSKSRERKVVLIVRDGVFSEGSSGGVLRWVVSPTSLRLIQVLSCLGA